MHAMSLITQEKLKKLREEMDAHWRKAHAAPVGEKPEKVGSTDWLEELAEKWERRNLDARRKAARDQDDWQVGRSDALEECIKELRAATVSPSNHVI
jgi:hypothetical protein